MNSSTISHCTPFLKHVAKDLLKRYGHDLSHLTVVFPNKRASLFLNEYLCELSEKPVWSPSYTTISELFRAHSPLTVADDIKLVCDLHRSYVACTGKDETLDQFYSWGEVMLSDFDDIDKSMADTKAIFTNLRDLHEYDSIDYLSDEQIKVLKSFFKDFNEHHNTQLKEKFLNLWSRFGDIYTHYNKQLRQQGLCYEGALFRSVVEDTSIDFGKSTFLFVGFNALQEVERQLFRRLRRECEVGFYWDYDRFYMENDNEAGASIRRFMNEFPNLLDSDDDAIYNNLSNAEREKHISYIGASTDSIQARYVGQWLQDERRVKDGNRTAIVLCNEGLLPTLIHCIPTEVEEVNITSGFPLGQTAVSSLIVQLLELSLFGRSGKDKYRQKFVISLLRHPYAMYISDQSSELCEKLVTEHRYYPSREELSLDDGLRMLFRDLALSSDPSQEYDANRETNQWLLDIIRHVAMAVQQAQLADPLTHESLFRAYTLINRLHTLLASGDLKCDPTTYQRLIRQLLSTVSIPFHGEPAVGLQVMGVLETRNLDFDHLLVLSCNEGNMPKGLDSPSFIPHSIRHAFGLSTIDNKVGLYAYYFFRMIQRAGDVTIMYGNAPEKKNTGEKSRFMLQLLLEGVHAIDKRVLCSHQMPTIRQRRPIKKSEAVMKCLHSMTTLSPTAINRYLRCPLLFFYNYVAGIKEPNDESDVMDNLKFGNIFHDASQMIYDEITGVDREHLKAKDVFALGGHDISQSMIDHVLKDPSIIERNLNKAIMKHLFKNPDGNKVPDLNGLQLINIKVIDHYLHQLMKIDRNLAPFTIRGLEGDVFTTIEVETSEGKRQLNVGGRIDRLDEVTDSDGERRIRVVDYKTGVKDVKSSLSGIDDVFDSNKIDNHSDYYLQAMLYSMIVRGDTAINPNGLEVSPALLFIQKTQQDNYSPVLKFDKQEIKDIQPYIEAFEHHLSALIAEIMEPGKPFEPTTERKRCANCIYSNVCGNNASESNSAELHQHANDENSGSDSDAI